MGKPESVEEFLCGLTEEQRVAIEAVRRQVVAAAPGVEEYLGYGMLGFKLDGKPLLYIGAAKRHCGIYGELAPEECADGGWISQRLASYKVSKGTIQFTPEKMLPGPLVTEIVKARVRRVRNGK
jgi:uncharacterized protein YdhG (YjbR/CyaY superfamily)